MSKYEVHAASVSVTGMDPGMESGISGLESDSTEVSGLESGLESDSTEWTTVIRRRKDKTRDKTRRTIGIAKRDRKPRNSLLGHGSFGSKPKEVRHKRFPDSKRVRRT